MNPDTQRLMLMDQAPQSASIRNTESGVSASHSLDLQRLPQHVAIIMDGNGRWAKQRLFPRYQGHRNAVRAVRATVEIAVELKIQALTLYAFSTENWSRPEREVSTLMELFAEYLEKELETMLQHNVRFRLLGERRDLPEFLQERLSRALASTAGNTGLLLNLAVNYGGRAELVRGVRMIAEAVRSGQLNPEDIDEALIARHTYTAGVPDPDLIIRTSGEQRTSNFLTWQSAYSELYFTEVLWPDFGKSDFIDALREYQNRARRLGGIDPVEPSTGAP